MSDEYEPMKELPKTFPELPYNTQIPPAGGFGGTPNNKNGGKPVGTQNVPLNKRNTGVRPAGQTPVSRTSPTGKPAQTKAAEIDIMSDEEVINLIDKIAQERGLNITIDDLN
jgi:hypothetical protein